MGSKVCRRQVCMSPAHREVPKTNGHSVCVRPAIHTKLHPSPRLGRPLNLRPHGASRYVLLLSYLLEMSSMLDDIVCVSFFPHVFFFNDPNHVCSLSSGVGTANSSCNNMYEKTFPIKVVQSPTHSTSSSRLNKAGSHCTAQEVGHEGRKPLCYYIWFI